MEYLEVFAISLTVVTAIYLLSKKPSKTWLSVAGGRSWIGGHGLRAKGLSAKVPLSKQQIAEFELEKKAYLSKAWLYVCHSSQFEKPGDYRTFLVAGVSLFVVLGKDLNLRAFHNVCRHRAYTVVRREQGNSMRFSCKYHGWQYNECGGLVKAPKFEDMPGFVAAENGLWEISLRADRNGFVFIFLAGASEAELPNEVPQTAEVLPNLQWKDSFTIHLDASWVVIANRLSSLPETSLFRPCDCMFHNKESMKVLDSLTAVTSLERGLWCTRSVLPQAAGQTDVRFDMFVREGTLLSGQVVQKWRTKLEEELMKGEAGHGQESIVVRHEGRSIKLSDLTTEHARREAAMESTSNPMTRFSGNGKSDLEAEQLAQKLARKVGPRGCSPKVGARTDVGD